VTIEPSQQTDKPGQLKPEDMTGVAEGTSRADADIVRTREPERGDGLPDPREVNRCRSCGALIYWRVNPSGARQPFDWDARQRMPTTMPHHATCPQGREWQRRRSRTVPVPEDA
jgi:hypothetical protein